VRDGYSFINGRPRRCLQLIFPIPNQRPQEASARLIARESSDNEAHIMMS